MMGEAFPLGGRAAAAVIQGVAAQARGAARVAAAVWTGALGLLAALWLLARGKGLSPDELTRDPAAVAGGSVLVGSVSTLGLVLWAAASAVCFFAAAVLRGARPQGSEWRFLLASGGLSAVLLLDDLFQFHEHVAPVYLGVAEKAVLGTYGLLTLAWLWGFRDVILRSEPLLLALAFGWFATAVGIDQLVEETYRTVFVEDAAKFLGIATWTAYLARAALGGVRRAHPVPAAAAG